MSSQLQHPQPLCQQWKPENINTVPPRHLVKIWQQAKFWNMKDQGILYCDAVANIVQLVLVRSWVDLGDSPEKILTFSTANFAQSTSLHQQVICHVHCGSLFNFVDYSCFRNYSVSLLLTIQPTKDFLSIPHNVTYISGSVFGHQLGLTGLAADEIVNITTELPYEWNTTQCKGPPYGCQTVQIYTCVHFQASPLVFPSSR